MARTTHHPALASHIAKHPPAILPTTAHHAIEGTIPVNVATASMSPPKHARIPTLSLAAFPAASMLHSMVDAHILRI